jgi:uncharacterized membrane protein
MILLRTVTGARRVAVLRLLGAATGLSVALTGARVLLTGSGEGLNLVWNLLLAWIPFVLAVLVYDGRRRAAPRALLLVGAALWLLFLPNAPYILTDAKWISDWTGAPDWFDALVVLAPATTGLALGFVSLYLMHDLARRFLGPPEAWLAVVAVLALSAFGVYLGRVQRWNSWDLFTRPVGMFSDIGSGLVDPLAHARLLAGLALVTACLTLGYAVFYLLAHQRLGDYMK